MNRKPRPKASSSPAAARLADWRQQLLTRRQLLIAAAGGSLAMLFPLALRASAETINAPDPWPLIDAVQQQLFPDELQAPGARDINALAYLKFIVDGDVTLDAEERGFITRGAAWLEDMALQLNQKSFLQLDNNAREKVLRRIAASEAGENWLSTLMTYILEALLTDPVYGGNTDQRGWTWLQHVPGYPRPPRDKIFTRLLR